MSPVAKLLWSLLGFNTSFVSPVAAAVFAHEEDLPSNAHKSYSSATWYAARQRSVIKSCRLYGRLITQRGHPSQFPGRRESSRAVGRDANRHDQFMAVIISAADETLSSSVRPPCSRILSMLDCSTSPTLQTDTFTDT